MKLLGFLPSLLFAMSKNRLLTFFIDGNNLYGHKTIPKNREAIKEKLLEIKQRNTNVVLVWDGKAGVQDSTVTERDSDIFTTVTTREGLTADEYILDEIRAIMESGVTDHEVQIVTGDRTLRSLALANKRVCTTAVDPVVFWRRYRPRLAGLKLRKEEETDGKEM